MDISVENITPERAKQMLERNVRNRPLRQSHVASLAKDMLARRWKNDGSPVRFSKTGKLLDGQHRLTAISVSGIAAQMVVITGLDDDVFDTIDTGSKRTMGDVLSLQGFANAKLVASIGRMVHAYENTGHPGLMAGKSPSNTEMNEFISERPMIIEAAGVVRSSKFLANMIRGSVPGWLFYEACKIGQRNVVTEFLNEVSNPTIISFGTTAILFREKLIFNKSSRDRMTKVTEAAYAVKAYRDYRDKRKVSFLKLAPAGGIFTKEYFKL